jgi:hypothetical protein
LKYISALFLMLLSFQSHAESIKQACRAALTVNGGVYTATLDGLSADVIRRSLPDGAVPSARITVIKRFKQEGCGRLKIDYMASLRNQNGGVPFTLTSMEVNMCEDGKAPAEGYDKDAEKRFKQLLDRAQSN